jgi:uncharacterized RDD family membrane protein YckC
MARGELNPYAAPSETPSYQLARPSGAVERRLATVNQRFGAHFVDFIVGLLPLTVVSLRLSPGVGVGEVSLTFLMVSLGSALLVPASVQWFLIANYGQSIGKRLFKTKVIRVDGSRAGFFHGVVLRSWVGCLPALVPIVGYAYAIADSLYVFRRDRRTLRDHIAGTFVIRA